MSGLCPSPSPAPPTVRRHDVLCPGGSCALTRRNPSRIAVESTVVVCERSPHDPVMGL